MYFKKKLSIFIYSLFLLFSCDVVFAQAIPNPCGFSKINCGEASINVLYTSFFSDTIVYAPPGRSMPFWFAFGDSVTEIIDTTGAYNFSLSKVSGPGDIKGVPGTAMGYYSYLSDISFSEVGTYEVQVNVSGFPGSFVGKFVFIVPPEIDFCSEAPAGKCGVITGFGGTSSSNQIFLKKSSSDVVPVDEVMPGILVGVIDSVSGLLDSTFSGTIYIEKTSGPGELYGILSMTGERWFNFNNLRISEPGYYTLRFFSEDKSFYNEAFVEIEVGETPNGFITLPRNNLVVYPNPFDNKIVCISSSDLKGVKIEIFTCSGQKVVERKVSSSLNQVILDTEVLKHGVYVLSITGTNSFENKTFKIVK